MVFSTADGFAPILLHLLQILNLCTWDRYGDTIRSQMKIHNS